MKYSFLLLVALVSTSACTQIPGTAYFERGAPESLLSVSSEEVTVSLENPGGERQLTDWIDRQQPSRAKLYCAAGNTCDNAAEILDQFNIPYDQIDGARNQVVLTFERVEARDCENRYITNHINPYNLNHPTFGCSMAVNQVQMVTDKTQFTDPKLLDQYDGQKATQNYDKYMSRDIIDLNSSEYKSQSAGESK